MVTSTLGPQWRVVAEYTFNHYGDRGSVDIVAWHPGTRILLLIEVKSELDDVQAVMRSMDVRLRLVPGLLARERGWRAAAVASVLVLPAESSARRAVARHEAIFHAALPARTVEVRRWLAAPAGPLRAVWFVADTFTKRAIRNPGSPGQIRAADRGAATLRKAPRAGREAVNDRDNRAEDG